MHMELRVRSVAGRVCDIPYQENQNCHHMWAILILLSRFSVFRV